MCIVLKETFKQGFLGQAALLTLIGFYIKVSTGIPEIALFLITLVYAFFRRLIDWRRASIALLLFALCLWISSIVLRVSIAPYIHSGMELIDSYNDAMYNSLNPAYIPLLYAAVAVLALLVVWV